MSIQRRLYERMSKLDQEKDIQEGPAHQNPLKTAYGGMQAAKNTPSMKAYYAQLKKDAKDKAPKTAAEREKERLARRESVDLEEKLQFKQKTKFKPSTARGVGTKKERKTMYDVMIDDVRVGLLIKDVSQDFNYGEGGSYMSFKILKPGSRNKYAETIQVDDVEDPNEFFKKLKANPRTTKRTIKAIKAHGVELTNLDSKHESVEYVEEAKVGDTVHLGHATKGGSGVKGKVVKIDGRNVHIKNDKGAMFKGPMDRVTVGEAIKYDAAHPDQGITGRVTGKGKRDRGPRGSKTSGTVRAKYSGHPAYKKGSPGLPIDANDIGRLIKTARRPETNPSGADSRNLRNPRLTKDHVEHGVAEGMADSAKRAAKILAARTPKNVHNPGHPEKSSAGDREARRRERDRKIMLNNREGVEDMTPAQNNDRKFQDNSTRKTVAKIHLPSTDAERADYVKKFQSDKAGKPGNTKQRKMRDLQMRLRGPK